MFVLPPPPRYPTSQLTTGGPGGTTLLETSNTLNHPTGPEYQLVVGEGTYVLRDDLHLATPPPHPSEAPVQNPNPLATTVSPLSVGTKLSLTTLTTQLPSEHKLFRFSTAHAAGSGIPPSIQEHPNESQGRDSEHSSRSKLVGFSILSNGVSQSFGEGNPALAVANGKDSKEAAKKKKPKSSIGKSSFLSRLISHDQLSKRLQERSPEGLLAIANINRALQWLDLSAEKKEEQLTKILFTKAHALCHHVNPITKGPSHLDIVVGFSTGDALWYEPFSQKYARINKNGAIVNSAILDVQWIPGSESLFLAAHVDGTLAVYDKEKEDAPFVPEDYLSSRPTNSDFRANLYIKKSVQSRNQKTNPVACWKVCNSKINGFAFSPDNRHLAVVSEDGSLRVIDYIKEQILGIYPSYYGGLLCVCWSPDGRYIVTGGQDDLVSIWSLEDSMLVARCQGHKSWVTAVRFDPWRCDERTYRIGSVGEDCRLLLWDFSVGMLHRPKVASLRIRGGSVSSHLPNPLKRPDGSTTRLRSNSNLTATSGADDEVVHQVESRTRTSMLPPVMAKQIDDHPLSWLEFVEDSIITVCNSGHIRIWGRPKEAGSEEGGSVTSGSNT